MHAERAHVVERTHEKRRPPRTTLFYSSGTTTYDYDANGNITTRGDQTLTWSVENRLRYVDVGGVRIATYTYDRDGNRVKKVENGETTIYIGKYYEKNLTTGVETYYYFLGGHLVAYRTGGAMR